MKSDLYVQFIAEINTETFARLTEILEQAVRGSTDRLHLLLSTPGGSVSHGLTLYTLLRGLPLEVWTYNIGQVDSVGVVVYCAGKKRLAAPQTRFLLHGISVELSGLYNARALRERLTALEADQQNICRVIAEATGQAIEKIERDLEAHLTLLPEQAQACRLVDEVRTEIVQPDAEILTILGKTSDRMGQMYYVEN